MKDTESYNETDEFLKIPDVARIFKKAPKTIYNWVEDGRIPASIVYRLGGLRFKKSEILAFIDMRRCGR